MEEQVTAMKKVLIQMDRRYREISDRQAAIGLHISNAITQLQDTLEVRKTELISQLDAITQTKLKILAAQRDQIETTQARLSSCLFFLRENLKTGNQGELMKSTEVKQVKELIRTFQPDKLEPSTKADMVFSALADLSAECQNYGKVDVAGSQESFKCYATAFPCLSKGITTAAVGEKNTAIMNISSQPSNAHSCTIITSELVSEMAGTSVRGHIERSGDSQYKINYQPTIKGRHQLHIKVEGQHIRGSPFPVSAVSPVEKLGTSTLTIGGVGEPMGVAVNQRGEVVVTEHRENCVIVFSARGEKVRSFGNLGFYKGQLNNPLGVAVDGEENILVTDTDNHRIQKFTAQGKFLRAVGTQGTGHLQFNSPVGIAVSASNGRVYVAESHRIQILSPDLSYLGTFGQFNYPASIACDSTGNVYVSELNNHRIQVFTAKGKFLRMLGRRGESRGELKKPYGIAIDSRDIVYVSEWGNHRVSVFTSEGRFVTSFGSEGEGPRQLKYPHGIAVDSSGVVYVCDTSNNRLQLTL